jgi:trans-aconitate 3-methyltransferase
MFTIVFFLFFQGYSEFRVRGFPSLTPLINEYSKGADALGPYWEQPGRDILDNHLVAIPSPSDVVPDKFSDFQRVHYTGDYNSSLPNPRPVILRKKTTWEGLHAYLRTFSSLHTFHERHPEDLENPEGDISTRFLNNLRREAEKAGAEGEEIEIELPLTVLLAKRA